MSTLTNRNRDGGLFNATESVVALDRPVHGSTGLAEQLELPRVFAETVMRYLVRILPSVSSQMKHWRSLAATIPDPVLRLHALASLGKQGNIEGAALFATLAPARHREQTIRALVAYQSAYNYLDTLSEQPSTDPVNNADELDQALLVAVHPRAEHSNYYRHNPQRDDGGYLTELIDGCREALAQLPSYAVVAPAACDAAGRIIDFQALNLTEPHLGKDPLESWAIQASPNTASVWWWETAAAAGSSLAVHALIAAAADPDLDNSEVALIERAYFPWIGGLHSLLDSLVDRREDFDAAQRSLVGYYSTPAVAAIGLSSLAQRATKSIESLPHRHSHQAILTAMCSYYLSAPQCYTAEAHTITKALTPVLGVPLQVAVVLFRMRRMAASLTLGSYT